MITEPYARSGGKETSDRYQADPAQEIGDRGWGGGVAASYKPHNPLRDIMGPGQPKLES